MKFFDYKILILLALTLVIYFIYREVEFLHSKFEKLDTEIKAVKLLFENKSEPKFNHPTTNITPTPLQNTIISEPKFVPSNIPVIQTKISDVLESDSVSVTSNKSNHDDDDDSNTSDTSELSQSSKHLAIYSNDNEQLEETQNSLLESVEANKNKMEFNYIEIPDVKNTMENIINDLSSDSKSVSSKKSNKSNKSNKSQLSNKSNQSNKSISQIKIKEFENELNETKLSSMKLPELKKYAEKYNILLTKKINGQPKLKNKNELITEILQKI